jgi:hypothetical protein
MPTARKLSNKKAFSKLHLVSACIDSPQLFDGLNGFGFADLVALVLGFDPVIDLTKKRTYLDSNDVGIAQHPPCESCL